MAKEQTKDKDTKVENTAQEATNDFLTTFWFPSHNKEIQAKDYQEALELLVKDK